MEISLNGEPANIILETEKNVGDVLSALEQWLDGSGNRLSGLVIDGMETGATGLAQAFERNLEGIQSLDIRISAWDELAAEALADLKDTCALYRDSAFEERPGLLKRWEESAAAAFIAGEFGELHKLAGLSFEGEGLSIGEMETVVDERLRELADPRGEIAGLEGQVTEIVQRMEEFSLNIQTGKDGKAAETLGLFSRIGEKLFRLLKTLKQRGFLLEPFMIDGGAAKKFLSDFNSVLDELTRAYEDQDLVIAGDLAEYELAPRLLKLYSALKDIPEERAVKK